MKNMEICRKIVNLGKSRQRTLVYYITQSNNGMQKAVQENYGLGIRIDETGEEASVSGISQSKDKMCRLLDVLASNYVTPVTLGDIVYDWIS